MRWLSVFGSVLILSSAIGCRAGATRAPEPSGSKNCCPDAKVAAVPDPGCSEKAACKPSCCKEQSSVKPGTAEERIEQALPDARVGIFQAKPQGCESKKASGSCDAKEKASRCGGEKEADSGCAPKQKQVPKCCKSNRACLGETQEGGEKNQERCDSKP